MLIWRIYIQIDSRYIGNVRSALLRAAAQAALRQQAAPPKAELTLRLTGNATLRRLNRQFLGHDEPTDVLSFPAQDPAHKSPGPDTYLGDIAISYPKARAQAKAAGHSLEAELRLLAVHGVLHLLGHDHARPRDKAAMWAAQEEILGQLKE